MTYFKLKIRNWSYEFTQDDETGELNITSKSRISVVQKAAEYVKAEASSLVASVPLPQIELRRSACESCDTCRKAADDEWYCQSCGCPEWERSRLQVKWEMPAATCPLGKWTGNI